jgi:hypothetical protein
MKVKKAVSKMKVKMQKGGVGCTSGIEKVVPVKIPNPIYVPTPTEVTQTPVIEFEQTQSFTLFPKVPNATLDKDIDAKVAAITAKIFENVIKKRKAQQANKQNPFLNLPDLVMTNIVGELLKNKVVNTSASPSAVEKLKATCKIMYDYANENKAFVQNTAEDVNKQQIYVIKSALQTHLKEYLNTITQVLQFLRKDFAELSIYPIITITYRGQQYSLIYSFNISMIHNRRDESDHKKDEFYNFDLMIGNGLKEYHFENAATCQDEGEQIPQKPTNWIEFTSNTVSDYIVSNMTITLFLTNNGTP